MKTQVFAAVALAVSLGTGCTNSAKKQEQQQHLRQPFYELVSDRDILYVPVIEPYRASSLDKGETWLLSHDTPESFPVISIGVSNNCIYGQADGSTWYLVDSHSHMRATYGSQSECLAALKSLQLPVHEIRSCKAWQDQLAAGKPCYWHPAKGQKYPEYPPLKSGQETILHIGGIVSNPEFKVDQQINAHPFGIYFFRIESDLPENPLLHFSVNNGSPALAENGSTFPVFSKENYLELVLYVPFPVAETHKVPEKERVRIFRNIALQQEK